MSTNLPYWRGSPVVVIDFLVPLNDWRDCFVSLNFLSDIPFIKIKNKKRPFNVMKSMTKNTEKTKTKGKTKHTKNTEKKKKETTTKTL